MREDGLRARDEARGCGALQKGKYGEPHQGALRHLKFARAPPAFGLREGKGQSAPAGGGAKGSVRALVESAFGVGKGGLIGMIDPLGLGSA